jgi:hypothetical protein
MKNKILATAALLLLIGAVNSKLMAQPGFDDDVTDTPVDGFVSILAGAAIAYGIKKSKNSANQEKK